MKAWDMELEEFIENKQVTTLREILEEYNNDEHMVEKTLTVLDGLGGIRRENNNIYFVKKASY